MAKYSTNILTGGTATALTEYSATYLATKAVDSNEDTRWATTDTPTVPSWWKYDLGAGVAKKVMRVGTITKSTEITNAFTIDGSNNDSDWTTIYTGNGADSQSWQYFNFRCTTAYRYWRINISSAFAGTVFSISEIQMYTDMSPNANFLFNLT